MRQLKVGLVGAIDRYNYGDVLFPLVVKESLEQRVPNASFVCYSSKESNLKKYDALPTNKMSAIRADKPDALVVVGGETLISPWASTFFHTIKYPWLVIILRLVRKLIGRHTMDALIRRGWKVKSTMPWTFKKTDYNVSKIIHNAVGGANFNALSRRESINVKINLEDADYISVRDPKALRSLIELGIERDRVILSPDSAFIMSDLYPLEYLREVSTVNLPRQEYISLQIGIKHLSGHIDTIAEQIEKIITNTRYSIVLVPLGRVPMHEDDTALSRLMSRHASIYGQSSKLTYLDDPGIFDTMYTIANSELIISSSLHGNLTALSYGKPSVPIGNVPKLDEFLSHYSVPDQKVSVAHKDIYSSTIESLNIDREQLSLNATSLKKKVHKNFDAIAEVLQS